MGIYGMMRTSASGMAAQANRLGTVADNIANVSTTGYKRASTEFSSLILESRHGEYISGSVESRMRYAISRAGRLQVHDLRPPISPSRATASSSSPTSGGQTFLTRAGSFVRDARRRSRQCRRLQADGLPACRAARRASSPTAPPGSSPSTSARWRCRPVPPTPGQLSLNLPATATVVAAANLPSANAATATYTGKTSLVAYDNLGSEVTLDIYATKTATGDLGDHRLRPRDGRRRRRLSLYVAVRWRARPSRSMPHGQLAAGQPDLAHRSRSRTAQP